MAMHVQQTFSVRARDRKRVLQTQLASTSLTNNCDREECRVVQHPFAYTTSCHSHVPSCQVML
ncbi:hypothetical protein J6590_061459 [Homalodisca vitripennis]|nr:hypothetical protein J6590_061459 [Homalodisca vitripennis]